MATDLHVHIEALVFPEGSEGSRWEHVSMPNMPRNQRLFDRLGLRDQDSWVEHTGKHRLGMPSDATSLTRVMCAHDEGHTINWLTLEQSAALENWYRSNFLIPDAPPFGWLFGNAFKDYAMRPELLPSGVIGVRMVYWFDN